jgi:hypothetical protein
MSYPAEIAQILPESPEPPNGPGLGFKLPDYPILAITNFLCLK